MLPLERRRVVKTWKSICPYIKDGLIFWCDGIFGYNENGDCVDIVNDSVVFPSSELIYRNTTNNGWTRRAQTYSPTTFILPSATNYTIEVIGSPNYNNGNEVGLLGSTNLGFYIYCGGGIRGAWCKNYYVSRTGTTGLYYAGNATKVAFSISYKNDENYNALIISGSQRTTTSASTVAIGSARNGLLPMRNSAIGGVFYGARLYNRHLSNEEMIANQLIDIQRWNLNTNI